MTIIQIDPLATTSLICTTATVQDYVEDMDPVVTTATGVATTIAASGLVGNKTPQHINLNVANHFVEALSDTQLAEMSRKLEQAEEKFVYQIEIGQKEGPKIYQKTPKNK